MRALFVAIVSLFGTAAFCQSKDLLNVYFDFDSYKLTSQAQQQLDSLWAKNKTENIRLQFSLKGHCDSKGTNQYNDTLSEQRVKAVQTYLVDKGATIESFISILAAGELEALNENKTEEERQLNRRVEIIITKNNNVITEERTGSLKEKIADTATKSGTNIVLQNINFVGGMHRFLPESTPMLNELLDAMKNYPALVIRVEGHICCIAGDADGPDLETGLNNLSDARARAVMEYLVSNGIDQKRISYKGFGHSVPLYSYPEKSAEEMKLNRRVEIKIISK